jgi:hypothetical protein
MTLGKLETARQLGSEGKALQETAQRFSVNVLSLTRALADRTRSWMTPAQVARSVYFASKVSAVY